jgi:membrane-associated phospholipid phosphatase
MKLGTWKWSVASTLCGAGLLVAAPVHAAGLGWGSLSDVLAVGLPAVAAGTSWSQGDVEGTKALGLSLVTAVGVSEVLKSQVHEWRPDHSDNKSFPSGHAAVAFAAASFMDQRYGQQSPVAAPVLYGAATLTAIARVQADKHHWKDVIAGGVLGWGSAKLWTKPVAGGRVALLPDSKGLTVAWQRPLN